MALALAAPAQAAPTPEVEPNDTLFQATVQVGSDGATGFIGTTGDVDIFVLRLRPQRQIRVTYQVTNAPTCANVEAVGAAILRPNGDDIGAGDDEYNSIDDGFETFTITTPGIVGGPSETFYLQTDGGASAVGCQYRMFITGASGEATDAIDPGPPLSFPVFAVPEPNDLEAQAFGPLSADIVYSGRVETESDVDYLWLPQRAGHALAYEFASQSTANVRVHSAGSTFTVARTSASGQIKADDVSAFHNDRRLMVHISGALNAEWRIRFTPAEAIGVTPPPPAPPAPVEPPYVGRQVSLSRKNGRYRGRVTGAQTACIGGIKVTLRRKGSKRSYGSARTRPDGSWSLRRKAVRGRAYVSITAVERAGFFCGSDISRTLRR